MLQSYFDRHFSNISNSQEAERTVGSSKTKIYIGGILLILSLLASDDIAFDSIDVAITLAFVALGFHLQKVGFWLTVTALSIALASYDGVLARELFKEGPDEFIPAALYATASGLFAWASFMWAAALSRQRSMEQLSE